jgi:hypothetical protein
MFKKTEKWFIKKINKINNSTFDKQQIRKTTYWLLFIPMYIKYEVVSGDYER